MGKDKTNINGNPVRWSKKKGRWVYKDDGVDAWDNPRACLLCKKNVTKEGHDACLGTLPGVKYACCGHGIGNGYIYFENGKVVRFKKLTSIENE